MRLIITSLASVTLIAGGSVAAVAQDSASSETQAAESEPEKITDRKHPDYVRCKSEKVIGSLSKRRRVCLTNRQWADLSRDQSAMAREFAQENTSRSAGQ